MKHKRWLLAMAGGIGIVGGLLGWMSGSRPEGAEVLSGDGPQAELGPGDALTVVSWNIHYAGGPTLDRGRGQSRAEVVNTLDSIAAHIRSWKPDIVALQEVDRDAVRSYGIDQLEWLRKATDMPYAAWTTTWDARWVPSPGLDPARHIGSVRSGQAVLSRFPLTEAKRHALPQPPANGWLYNRFYLHRALLEVSARLGPDLQVRIVNAHLEAFHTDNRMDHARQASALLAGGARHSVLLGDMNCVPPEAAVRGGFVDEPETDMSTDETVNLLRNIPGMSEVVPAAVNEAHEAAWWTFPAHEPNRRLDYVFHGKGLTLATAQVPQMDSPPSDHLPVVVSFRVE
jgi:endonuclease/exonuclease/phosphatase family metal-dependent hydrolase